MNWRGFHGVFHHWVVTPNKGLMEIMETLLHKTFLKSICWSSRHLIYAYRNSYSARPPEAFKIYGDRLMVVQHLQSQWMLFRLVDFHASAAGRYSLQVAHQVLTLPCEQVCWYKSTQRQTPHSVLATMGHNRLGLHWPLMRLEHPSQKVRHFPRLLCIPKTDQDLLNLLAESGSVVGVYLGIEHSRNIRRWTGFSIAKKFCRAMEHLTG